MREFWRDEERHKRGGKRKKNGRWEERECKGRRWELMESRRAQTNGGSRRGWCIKVVNNPVTSWSTTSKNFGILAYRVIDHLFKRQYTSFTLFHFIFYHMVSWLRIETLFTACYVLSGVPERTINGLFWLMFYVLFQESHSRARGTAAAYGTGGIRAALWQGAGGESDAHFISKPTGGAVTTLCLRSGNTEGTRGQDVFFTSKVLNMLKLCLSCWSRILDGT